MPLAVSDSSLAWPAADEAAIVRADRARTELRHGRAVAVVASAADRAETAEAAAILVAVALETTSAERVRSMIAGPRHARLLLSAERLAAVRDSPPDRQPSLAAQPHDEARPAAVAETPATAARDEFRPALSLAIDTAAGLEGLLGLAGLAAVGGRATGLKDVRPATPAMQAAVEMAKAARLAPALVVVEWPAAERGALEAAEVVFVSVDDLRRAGESAPMRLGRVSEARVPVAAHDDCTLVLFREADGDAEHVAIVVGRPDVREPVAVRLHSACFTGDLLGSLRCDCGDQLRGSIEALAAEGGVLLYLAQEGRGIGLANKLRAYRLQDGGLDTIDADRYLGFSDDERDFRIAATMLEQLGIRRVRMLTNNPRKIDRLRRAGIEVVDRIAVAAPVNVHNRRYIETKRERAGHLPAGVPGEPIGRWAERLDAPAPAATPKRRRQLPRPLR